MNVFELLDTLERQGITFLAHPTEYRLKVSGSNRLSGEAREGIREHKDTLVWLARAEERLITERKEGEA